MHQDTVPGFGLSLSRNVWGMIEKLLALAEAVNRECASPFVKCVSFGAENDESLRWRDRPKQKEKPPKLLPAAFSEPIKQSFAPQQHRFVSIQND